MRIAQVAPLLEAVPPKLYGGTERVVAQLCNELVDLGHEVTLFASAEARTRAELVAARDQAIRLDSAPLKSDLAAHLAMLYEVRRRARQFDLLHFHTDMVHFPMFEAHAHRCVTTLHGRLDLKDLGKVYSRWSQYGLVSISNSQRRPLPAANWLGTVYHGISGTQFPFKEKPEGNYLVFIGRISPEKRPDVAIRLACRVGMPLKIAAKIDAADGRYYESFVKPLLDDPLVEFIGEVNDSRKAELLGNATALLFPIDWPEPFGLVMIEAMACGTPTVAWNRGSVPEIIVPGVSGLIVNSEAEAERAILQAATLDRRKVRQAFERRYTGGVMAGGYLDIYQRLLYPQAARPA
ncbi:MAG: glycosyltransferase family 4 protein [Gammaproteobacteria bacterium]|nr:glycosyltransferase family 4 protein [Gammaproteobacteria bacterium]